MANRKLPPFAAVRAFESVARHLSVKRASEELCLSPSAVSHQLRALEAYFDTALFERKSNRLRLTLTGESYATRMTALLDDFDRSTRSVHDKTEQPFHVVCTPSFASRWLVPRLDRLRFGAQIRLRISDGLPDTDFASNDADVAIQWADNAVPGVITEPLMISGRYPVASPSLVERENIRVPEDLLRVPLIHFETMDGWAQWFEAVGLEVPNFPRGPIFPHCELATTAAELGQGVAMALDATVRDSQRQGRLLRLFDTSIPMHCVIYSVAYPEPRKNDPRIREFSDWLHAEAAQEGVHPGADPEFVRQSLCSI